MIDDLHTGEIHADFFGLIIHGIHIAQQHDAGVFFRGDLSSRLKDAVVGGFRQDDSLVKLDSTLAETINYITHIIALLRKLEYDGHKLNGEDMISEQALIVESLQ